MIDIAISIIVVSLNTKKDFLKTLNSILNQKFSSYEIIVIMVTAMMEQKMK